MKTVFRSHGYVYDKMCTLGHNLLHLIVICRESMLGIETRFIVKCHGRILICYKWYLKARALGSHLSKYDMIQQPVALLLKLHCSEITTKVAEI